jgi:hypothetical protein
MRRAMGLVRCPVSGVKGDRGANEFGRVVVGKRPVPQDRRVGLAGGLRPRDDLTHARFGDAVESPGHDGSGGLPAAEGIQHRGVSFDAIRACVGGRYRCGDSLFGVSADTARVHHLAEDHPERGQQIRCGKVKRERRRQHSEIPPDLVNHLRVTPTLPA